MEEPEVRYAKSGDVSIAYSVVGDGPFDLVFVGGWAFSALEYAWQGPPADFFRRLASFSRLILFDKRGTGLSDRATGIPDLETRMDDIRAVMEAAGSKRAAIMGVSEGGPMTLLFAATYPQRTAAAILYGAGVSFVRTEDFPWALSREDWDELIRQMSATGETREWLHERLEDRRMKEVLNQHHALVRRQLVRFAGRELDTVGDGFFASFDGPARAIRCACAITDGVRGLGLDVGAGLHTGECELVEGKVGGIAVHIGARVAAEAAPGEVLVSSTVKDLVAGSGLGFRERGVVELKGVPGPWRLYSVEPGAVIG